MTKDARVYFAWLIKQIEYINRPSMKKLYEALFEYPFTWTLERDANRAEDGLIIRNQFVNDTGYFLPEEETAKPCSVLEMMVALAERCDNATMVDFDDRKPWIWFDEMIKSLGLETQTDDSFDQTKVQQVLYKFVNRQYTDKGKGSLFYIPNAKYDMRTIEIWYQMNMYINYSLGY